MADRKKGSKKTIPVASAHEWVSFDDPTAERTWLFDVTFLLSGWTCIFGHGCQGVLTGPAPELEQGCCSYGAHFTDDEDVARVQAAADTLTPDQWQFAAKGRRKGPIKTGKGAEMVSRLVDGACVFLNRPDFPGGAGCALHRAALETGRRPLDLKPNVCWQLPLRREDTVEDDGHVVARILQWDRRHWGEGGAEFHWWCTESPDAFIAKVPVYRQLRDELVEMVGADIYALVASYLDGRRSDHPLAHPAVRAK